MTDRSNGLLQKRSRAKYILAMVLVIGMGLLLRSRLLHLPLVVTKYGGDALWALLVFLLCGLVCPRCGTLRLGIIAFAIACFVEVSQLYHSPWIDEIRRTHLGRLALGSVFNWPDIPAYAFGIFIGVLVESAGRRRREKMANLLPASSRT